MASRIFSGEHDEAHRGAVGRGARAVVSSGSFQQHAAEEIVVSVFNAANNPVHLSVDTVSPAGVFNGFVLGWTSDNVIVHGDALGETLNMRSQSPENFFYDRAQQRRAR